MLCLFTHVVTIYGIDAVANEIDVVLKFFDLGTKIQNLFNKNKTKLLLFKSFSCNYLLSYLCWLYTSGFKCQRQNIFSLATPTREIVHQYVEYRNEDCQEYTDQYNMKQARPWMLANLKIICKFHVHPVHQNSVEMFWAKIYRGRRFLGSNPIVTTRPFSLPCK